MLSLLVEMGEREDLANFLPGLSVNLDPPTYISDSKVVGVTSVGHHTWPDVLS
jgi:hypothetical protein